MKALLKKLILSVLLILPTYILAGPVAMVMDLQGTATANNKALELLAELDANTSIMIGDKSTLTLVYLQTGEEYVLKGPSKAVLKEQNLEVAGKSVQGKTLLASAEGLASGNYSQAAIVMRSGKPKPKKLGIYSPVSTGILDPNPTLSWQNMGKGFEYHVEVLSENGDSLFEIETKKNKVSIPKSVKLPRTELLNWEVEASRGSITYYNMADFFIVSLEDNQQIQAARPAKSDKFSRKLLYAWMLENKGITDEAQKYWKMLAKERPNDRVILSKLR